MTASTCTRCGSTSDDAPGPWCKDCERLYDTWSRQHATDIVWQALIGTAIVSGVGIGLPLLGIGKLVAALGAIAGFGTIFGLSRWTRRHRRRQFLTAPLPRAYLPAPK
jgi:Flp pilus assembly protein TadB